MRNLKKTTSVFALAIVVMLSVNLKISAQNKVAAKKNTKLLL